MATWTKAKKNKLAEDFVKFLVENELDGDVLIYVNGKRIRLNMDFDKEYNLVHKRKDEEDVDWHDYMDYGSDIMTVSTEGSLYDVLNYECGKQEEKVINFFKERGLYFELGNAWNFGVYES